MKFTTKIALVIRDDLAPWQKLNVAAFLSGGLAGHNPGIVGEPYRDASGAAYGPLIAQPVLVFAADAAALKAARDRAAELGLMVSIYTEGLFRTGNDIDNRAVVAALATQALDLVGLAAYGERKLIDKIVKGLALHS